MMSRRWELAVLLAILVASLVVRTIDLSTLPAGFHGDEAITGLEGQRILDEGYIGPYSSKAAGQPSGPLYLTAVSVALFDNTRFAVRIVPALVGTLTVLVLYLLLRRSFGPAVGLLGAGILGFLGWHIHFARIGYPLEAWPLAVLVAAWTVSEAVERRSWRWWAAAGAATGAGIYVYNAHPLYIGISFLFIGLYVLITRRALTRPDAAGVAVFSAALAVVAIPMLHYVLTNTDSYLFHFRHASLVNGPEWQSLDSPVAKADFVQDRYVDFWNRLTFNPDVDVVDATGTTAVVPTVTLLLGAAGMVVTLMRYRHPLVYFGALVVFLLPFGITLTEGALTRRTFPIAIFLAMFIAIGAVEVVRMLRGRRVLVQRLSIAVLAVVLGVSIHANLDGYFNDFAEASTEERLLAAEYAEVSRFLSRIPNSYYVYFYSEKWSINYEPRQFLAPEVAGEDRSETFGEPGFAVDGPPGRPLFVFLDDHRSNFDLVRTLYPSGRTMIGGPETDPHFIAYEPLARRADVFPSD